MEPLILLALVLLMLLVGVPVGVALGLSSVMFVLFFTTDSMTSLALKLFDANEHFLLLAIPFFILSSSFMATGGVAQRIIRFAIATVGHIRGGLAMAGVFACMLFAALSGSSPATVIAVGTIAIAGMRQVGYSKEFAAGVICNAGTLGILIPPSIVMVVYAAATDVSVGRMFLGGLIPGLTAGVMLMIGIYFAARWQGIPAQAWKGWQEVGASFASASWGLFLIVIILGGIYGGIFTPTEAAAIAAVYAFLVANFVYRDMGPLKDVAWRRENEHRAHAVRRNGLATVQAFIPACFHADTRGVLVESARTTIMLMFIIANALLFAHVLTLERVPQAISTWMLDAGFNWWTFLLAINIILLIGGQFMEPSGLLLIVAPVAFPVATQLGVDPIHLGILMVVNMEIGMITPPIGLNLFVTSAITGMSLLQVVRAALPWVMILVLFLILVTYVPAISTWLPTLLMGPEIVTR